MKHGSSPGVGVVTHKKSSGKETLSYEDLVHGWAASNKRRVEALIDTGLITLAGLVVIERAKADGSWAKLSAQERQE